MDLELFYPERFYLKVNWPTKPSDRHALGTALWEVLGGQVLFYRDGGKQKQGAESKWSRDDIWNLASTTLLEAQSRRLPEDQRPNQINASIRVTCTAFALLSTFPIYDTFSPHPLL